VAGQFETGRRWPAELWSLVVFWIKKFYDDASAEHQKKSDAYEKNAGEKEH
jgi:hypothetical protein